MNAGEDLPGWICACAFKKGQNPFTAAAEKQVATYFWTAVLVVAVIAIFATLMGHHLLRQLRLNRLKNDFVATVSHELKTPLASMRVLVDTLIDGRQGDAGQATEYLQLISKENERLSRLIDNFLTFSRMERNKRSFHFADVNPDQVVQAALDAMRERFEAAGVKLDVAEFSGPAGDRRRQGCPGHRPDQPAGQRVQVFREGQADCPARARRGRRSLF